MYCTNIGQALPPVTLQFKISSISPVVELNLTAFIVTALPIVSSNDNHVFCALVGIIGLAPLSASDPVVYKKEPVLKLLKKVVPFGAVL